MYIYIYICTHTHIYIYIYIYSHMAATAEMDDQLHLPAGSPTTTGRPNWKDSWGTLRGMPALKQWDHGTTVKIFVVTNVL